MAEIRMCTPWKFGVYKDGKRVNAFTTLAQARWWTTTVKHWDYIVRW